MTTAQSPDPAPHIINNGTYEVASHHVGKSLIDMIWDCFTSGKIRGGDYFLGRSRSLIQQYYTLLPSKDQKAIYLKLKMTIQAKESLDRTSNASLFRRRTLAKDYKQVAHHLFIIVERASQRAANTSLVAQLEEASDGGDPQPPRPPLGTTSTISNPFTDSHEVSSLADVDIGNLSQVEMSVYASEDTGEAAAIFDLHGRDASTQQVIATFSPEVVVANEIDAVSQAASIYDNQVYDSHSEAGDDDGR
ncbi:hypothetical protein EI94DRAFT_1736091 [Lactarius quietus]|nr:hypothetical protein EI94DRAFT_1736091 [Lactarius quietus]